MFYYQPKYYSQCVPVTRELFMKEVSSPEVDRLCNNIEVSTEQAFEYEEGSEMYKKWHDSAGESKRKLPLFLFCAGHIAESVNSKGVSGTWRKAESIMLNGLCMVDIDHIADSRGTYKELCTRLFGYYEEPLFEEQKSSNAEWDKYGVLLIHVTASGHGLRFVFKADAERGNLADNQRWLCEQLGFRCDEACKDSSRGSFVVRKSNILYLNDQIFDYENKEFEKKYGDDYRHGRSQAKSSKNNVPAHRDSSKKQPSGVGGSADPGGVGSGSVDDVSDSGSDAADTEHEESSEMASEASSASADRSGTIEVNEDGQECYKYRGHLIPYREIVQKLVEARGGEPGIGGRNNMLYDLVRLDLRHICDNDASFCFRVAPDFGLSEKERKETIDSALRSTRYGMSRTLRNVLSSFVLEQKAAPCDGVSDDVRTARFSHAEIWNTFKPFLGGVWSPVVSSLDDDIKFAGFLAAGAMFGTYLSAVTLKNFYDNNDWRLSFMVYIIGQAASGKGAFVELNKLVMAPLRMRDEEGRRWEEKYKEDKEKRNNSSSNQKAKAMEIEHFPIRVLPGTISNAMRYKRMKDAVRVINGENVHLHCYIFESELSAKLRSEQGTWAGAQDLDCKSFSNEFGGNDYGNAQAVNGLIEVNMNQVITGTHDAMNRKITSRNCLDGLATRLIMFEMPDSSFKMLKKENARRSDQETEWLSTIGEDLIDCAGIVDLSQKVRVPKSYQSDYGTQTSITDALYQWGVDEASRCSETKDVCADYFRRRAPVIAARYAAVDAIMNDLSNFKTTGKVKITWRQVDLAIRLASYFQESQMYFFGGKVLNGLADEAAGLTPQRKVQSKTTDLFESLGKEFTLADVQRYMPNYYSATTRIRRWVKEGVVEKKKGCGKTAVYKKLKKVL